MGNLPPLDAAYQRHDADWAVSHFRDCGDSAPVEAVTVRCPIPGCRGHGGHLVRYRDRRRGAPDHTDDTWWHLEPRGFARNRQTGAAWESHRARKRKRAGAVVISRRPHGSATGDLYARPLGSAEPVGDAWFLGSVWEIELRGTASTVMLTECANCGRRLRYRLDMALR